jgi:predicted amidohydrolase
MRSRASAYHVDKKGIGIMKVGYVQMKPVLHNVEANLEKIARMISDVDADLLVLPELCTTGYLFKHRDELVFYAEPILGGRTALRLSELAKENACNLVAGIAEADGARVFNSSVLISRAGDICGCYRKIHLFMDEKDLFDPGENDPLVFTVDGMRLGLMVCFDWIFPEVTRILALDGADVVCHSANLVLPYAHDAMVTRALENRVFVILSNRVGHESLEGQTLHFNGGSRIIDPCGAVVVNSDGSSEDVQVVEIHPENARNKMITPRNHVLNDRKPERYTGLLARPSRV